MAARKSTPEPVPEKPAGITLTPNTVKWIVGFFAALFAAVVGYWQISDRIDAHWRLEQVQQAKDREYAAEIKRIDANVELNRAVASHETAAMAKKAEVGRAWVVWSVTDAKASLSVKFVKLCKALKLPVDECASWDDEAHTFKQDAATAKQDANAAGKDTK